MSKDTNTNQRDQVVHIIHHDDPDGICAAAVVLFAMARKQEKRPTRLYPVNYNQPPDVSMMAPGDMVIIVDFSYPPAEMKKIESAVDNSANGMDARNHFIVWIDHHKTAAAYGYDDFPGLRDFSDKGSSGCELAWRYFMPDSTIPLAVQLIGDYDSWRLQMPDSKMFHEGTKMLCPTPMSALWSTLLFNQRDAVDFVSAAGSIAMQYRDAYCARMRQSFGYETMLSGHAAYALNVYGFGSQGFGELFDRYPLVIAYAHDGQRFTCSLYSEKVDVGAIAKTLGGGGHTGAAGFVCDVLPFFPAKGE